MVLIIQSPKLLYGIFVCIKRDLITSAGVDNPDEIKPDNILDNILDNKCNGKPSCMEYLFLNICLVWSYQVNGPKLINIAPDRLGETNFHKPNIPFMDII